MYSIKLQPLGEQILRSYCKNREDLFEVVENSEKGFKVRCPRSNWWGKIIQQGQMMELYFDNEKKRFYLYLSPNIIRELYIDELIDLFNFIDKIRDETPEQLNLNLFEDEDGKNI